MILVYLKLEFPFVDPKRSLHTLYFLDCLLNHRLGLMVMMPGSQALGCEFSSPHSGWNLILFYMFTYFRPIKENGTGDSSR